LFVVLLMREFGSTSELWLRVWAIIFFLTICAFWILILVVPLARSFLRVALATVAWGSPALVLALVSRRLRMEGVVGRIGVVRIAACAMCVIFVSGVVSALFSAVGVVWDCIAAPLVSLEQVWITYHLVRRGQLGYEKFTLSCRHISKSSFPGSAEESVSGGVFLSRELVEEYFRLRRPYLDPGLSLPSLADALGVRRAELSTFINRTFGVNFPRYVNRWRLAEFERLMSLPSNELKNPYKVAAMAGFSDTRHFIRVFEQEKSNLKIHNS
jgi:AraC-like DNA-binding protein